ncbi:Transmembrane protein 231-like Protein [Tribolium castaneum]|uniref:Transmembrane protein 231 n=1 Tax=Tribolium castaneum TaxID=7070 RepID=A0A139WH16_TRICA|nr:Transmembrane protein 231-like Protein [Tribolium castaneum]
MVVLEVFTKNIKISYKSTLLSKASVLALIFGVLSLVLPFIFAYKSKGLWLKRDTFYEQPDVKFRGEYIFVATTNNYNKSVITCSNLPHFDNVLRPLDTCSVIKVRETDRNFDGKTEELDLSLQVNLPVNTHLTSFCIIIPFNYKLQVCPLEMQTAIIFQELLPFYISKYSLVANVVVTQTSPLICHRKNTNTLFNYPVIVDNGDLNNYDINTIITNFSKRNISTSLRDVYKSFSPGKTQNFVLNLNIEFPEDRIYYKPGFWQVLKWAWIHTIFLAGD